MDKKDRDMKNISNKIFLGLIFIIIASCVEPEDLVTENARSGGALLSVVGSNGKLLGIEDPSTGVVDFTDFDMELKISLVLGQFDGETFTLVKTYKSQEVEVIDFETLPFTYNVASVDEFLSGFTGVTASDLRIGDVIKYVVKIHTKGETFTSGDAIFEIKVNCGSDLAGLYSMSGLYQRPASGIVDQAVGPKDDLIQKYGTNLYGTQFSGHFTPAQLGFDPCPVFFTITCGLIEIPAQNLCNAYSNVVSGTGYLDEATGSIYLEYQITGGNLRTYTFTYSPK